MLIPFLLIAGWWQSSYAYTPSGIEHLRTNETYVFGHLITSGLTLLGNALISPWVTFFQGVSWPVTASLLVGAALWAWLMRRPIPASPHPSPPPRWRRRHLVAAFAVSLACSGLIYLSLLLTWVNAQQVDLGFIDGFQLRYAIPLLALLVVPLLVRRDAQVRKTLDVR